MTTSGTTAFLRQAYRNNWQRYLTLLESASAGGWDVCVLTASNERQAEMYRRQLALRSEAGLLPRHTVFEVISDPDGQRIGSGGATLRVLGMLSAADKLQNRRVLIIHSGGDSRRLPHCSATGKLFARIPRALPDGRASTLFDELLISLSGAAAQAPSGVLIASGDVLLIFDHVQLNLHRPGVTGVAIASPAEMGTHHGVYVLNNDERRLQPPHLNAFLHKPSLTLLQQWQAIANDGTVPVDTGLVWLDRPTADKFTALAEEPAVGRFCGSCSAPSLLKTGLNLYGDLMMPLVVTTTHDTYLADASDGPATPALQAARQIVWEQLRGTSLAVERLQPAIFAHFGTSREYWKLVAASPEWADNWGWTHSTSSWQGAPMDTSNTGATLMNAIVDQSIYGTPELGLIVDSHITSPLVLHGPALIAGLKTSAPLTLNADVVVHQLPVGGNYVTRILGLDDDPKQPLDSASATFMNRPWADWLNESGISPEIIWPQMERTEQTLWNAQLYPLATDRETSLKMAIGLQDPPDAPAGWQEQWENSKRLSLAESFNQANSKEILDGSVAIGDQVAISHFFDAVKSERPAATSKTLLGSAFQVLDRRAKYVSRQIERQDTITQIRMYKALAVATGDNDWEDRAFAVLAGMIEKSVNSQRSVPGRRWPIARHKTARVEAAARIDFGGGWTDTPPYSIERGGTVLNAAIIFNNHYPIVAEVERLPEPRLILESTDIDAVIEPTLAQVQAYANPTDPFALLKAAIVLRGIIPADVEPKTPIAQILQELGGLRLRTQTTIPRGSGLGTSSILAGAVLSCLSHWLRIEQTQTQLFDDVLCLEQMLTTGGGWQDQVGGLTDGIKLVTTRPGLPQEIQVEPLKLPPDIQAGLSERLVLVYTGQQRLAKNLLQAVMGRWMARDPEMIWIQSEIARLAVAMQRALEAGDLDTFGALLGEHWVLNKRMDPGCTNPFIDQLFEIMTPYINGGKLAGAGGGGFAIVVARNRAMAQRLYDVLDRQYPGTQVGVWPCAIPDQGTKSILA
ncbi:MAG: hypothetical protein JXA89_07980 [Anaerolineae bacterium]|nr:hypothetical protein [Anaerolineae bacterium]